MVTLGHGNTFNINEPLTESAVTGGLLHKGPVMRSVEVSLVSWNNLLSRQLNCRSFLMQWLQCDIAAIPYLVPVLFSLYRKRYFHLPPLATFWIKHTLKNNLERKAGTNEQFNPTEFLDQCHLWNDTSVSFYYLCATILTVTPLKFRNG